MKKLNISIFTIGLLINTISCSGGGGSDREKSPPSSQEQGPKQSSNPSGNLVSRLESLYVMRKAALIVYPAKLSQNMDYRLNERVQKLIQQLRSSSCQINTGEFKILGSQCPMIFESKNADLSESDTRSDVFIIQSATLRQELGISKYEFKTTIKNVGDKMDMSVHGTLTLSNNEVLTVTSKSTTVVSGAEINSSDEILIQANDKSFLKMMNTQKFVGDSKQLTQSCKSSSQQFASGQCSTLLNLYYLDTYGKVGP